MITIAALSFYQQRRRKLESANVNSKLEHRCVHIMKVDAYNTTTKRTQLTCLEYVCIKNEVSVVLYTSFIRGWRMELVFPSAVY